MQVERNSLENLEEHRGLGVCFDPEEIKLIGWYRDEMSAHRARKIWQSTLHDHFLLESDHDYQLQVSRQSEHGLFQLCCHFVTACARYAFWRITNSQAPEVQYVLETAHIPSSENFTEEFLRAPDMCHIEHGPLVLNPKSGNIEVHNGWFDKMIKLLDNITKKA